MSLGNLNFDDQDNSFLRKPKYNILRDFESASQSANEQRAKDTNCLTLKRELSIDLIAIRKQSIDAEDYFEQDKFSPPEYDDHAPFSDLFGNSVGNYYKSKSQTGQDDEKKFLLVPSVLSGICLGTNNFFLSYISKLGLPAALIFSLGALVFCILLKIYFAFRSKKQTGEYFPVEGSNFFKINRKKQTVEFNYLNFLGLVLRTVINIGFQFFIILAFKHAGLAGLNSGVITALFATYCVFVSILMRIFFKEILKVKFYAGILCMLICVSFISFSALSGKHSSGLKDQSKNAILALSFGLMAPLMISIMITISRYWTEKHAYSSLDYSIDTFVLLSLAEIGFFIYYAEQNTFTWMQIVYGVAASVFQIAGTCFMIYSATFGLAGPASAMVQSQAVVQTVLEMVFQSKYPTLFDIIGMLFALLGAVIMTVDFTMLFTFNKDKNIEDQDQSEDTDHTSKNSNQTYRTQHTDWTVPTYYHG